jgi:glycosyltransferase involved in cell wall biosynthesis
MKILLVGLATFEQMAGGSARYVSGVSAGLSGMGHSVEVRTAATHVPTVGHTEPGIVGQLRRLMIRLLVTMPGTVWAVVSGRPDLVNVHFALDGLPAVLAAGIRGVPVVVNFQGPWAIEALATGRRGSWPLSTRARRVIEAFVYRRAQRSIVLSEAFGDLMRANYGVSSDRIRVIAAGIDTRRFEGLPSGAEARRRLGVPEAYTIVTVRRLVPRMGIDLAIDALARLAPRLDGVLVIAGAGPERNGLEALARSLGIERRVRFLGQVPDEQLPLVYAAADVCVVPSRELEGFGYVALEALAAGRPVIAAGTGGLPELVGRLEPRWVVSADPDALAAALLNLASRRADYPDSAACVAYAATMDWSVILPRVVDVFQEALNEGARHG